MKLSLLVFCSMVAVLARAATVDTISISSGSMHKAINCVVIRPDSYKKKKNHFPVVYLLHGYGGSYNNWIIKVPELKEYADQYQMMIVCPDGGYGSWYFNSPVDSSYRYENYITYEVTNYIDSAYRTLTGSEYRAITGLSMGGHGALYLAMRHVFFGAAGSMSGGVDLSQSKNKFEIAKRLGDTLTHAQDWFKNSVVNMVDEFAVKLKRIPSFHLKIIFDCGISDMFIEGNRKLHQKMLQLKIPHDYIERPGDHNWEYWKNAVGYQLLFFHRFFNEAK